MLNTGKYVPGVKYIRDTGIFFNNYSIQFCYMYQQYYMYYQFESRINVCLYFETCMCVWEYKFAAK